MKRFAHLCYFLAVQSIFWGNFKHVSSMIHILFNATLISIKTTMVTIFTFSFFSAQLSLSIYKLARTSLHVIKIETFLKGYIKVNVKRNTCLSCATSLEWLPSLLTTDFLGAGPAAFCFGKIVMAARRGSKNSLLHWFWAPAAAH